MGMYLPASGGRSSNKSTAYGARNAAGPLRRGRPIAAPGASLADVVMRAGHSADREPDTP